MVVSIGGNDVVVVVGDGVVYKGGTVLGPVVVVGVMIIGGIVVVIGVMIIGGIVVVLVSGSIVKTKALTSFVTDQTIGD